jgi:ATP-binding cassette subfamily C protein
MGFRDIVRIFLTAPGTRPLSVLMCMLLAGVFELVGAGMVLPLVGAATNLSNHPSSTLGMLVNRLFEVLDIEPTIGRVLLVLGISMALKCLLSFAAMSYVACAVADVSTRVRRLLLDALMDVRWSYFTEHHPGLLANAMSQEASGAAEAYNNCAVIMTESLKIGVALLIAVLVSGTFFFAAMLGAVFVAAPTMRLVKASKRSGQRQWERTARLVAYVQDAFANMKALKSMQRQDPYAELFARNIGYLREALVRTNITRHALNYGQDTLISSVICLGLYLGMTVFGMALPELLVLGFVFIQFIQGVKKLQTALQGFYETEPAFAHCMGMIAEARRLAEQNHGTRLPTLDKGCRLEGVSFGYSSGLVLDDVTLDIPAKAITVLVGPVRCRQDDDGGRADRLPQAARGAGADRQCAARGDQHEGVAQHHRLCAARAGASPWHDQGEHRSWRRDDCRRPDLVGADPGRDRRFRRAAAGGAWLRGGADGDQAVGRTEAAHFAGPRLGAQTEAAHSR